MAFYDDPWDDDDEEIFRESRPMNQVIETGDPHWIDGRGKRIPIRKMTSTHILNCIQMLDERIDRLDNVLRRYGQADNVVGARQIEIWTETIHLFFRELERRADEEDARR